MKQSNFHHSIKVLQQCSTQMSILTLKQKLHLAWLAQHAKILFSLMSSTLSLGRRYVLNYWTLTLSPAVLIKITEMALLLVYNKKTSYKVKYFTLGLERKHTFTPCQYRFLKLDLLHSNFGYWEFQGFCLYFIFNVPFAISELESLRFCLMIWERHSLGPK